MSLWRRREYDGDTVIRDSFILLAPIILTCVAVLWFLSDPWPQSEVKRLLTAFLR